MKLRIASLLLLVLVVVPALAFASSEAWDFTAPSEAFSNGSWSFGNVFTVGNANQTVSALGYYDQGNPLTFTSGHEVGIFDTNGNLIAFTTVTAGNCSQVGFFCFTSIAPVSLAAGQQYLIEGVSHSDLYTWDDPGFFVNSGITYNGNNWIASSTFIYNGFGLINDVSDGYWGPNMLLSAGTGVPEPSALLLLGSGLLGIASTLRKRMQK